MISRPRALLTALLALVVGCLAYVLGVTSQLGQRAEASALDAAGFNTDPSGPLRFVSTPNVLLALAVIGLVALWVHGIRRCLTIVLVASFAILASQVLKNLWLSRPQLVENDYGNSFPSGHMTVLAALVAALIWALPQGFRALVMLASALLLGVASWQLLEYGWHRPSDVLGAQALVIFSFALASAIGPRSGKLERLRPHRVLRTANRIMSVILTLLGIAMVLGAIVCFFIAVFSKSDVLMLTSGETAMVGTGVLAVRTLAKLSP